MKIEGFSMKYTLVTFKLFLISFGLNDPGEYILADKGYQGNSSWVVPFKGTLLIDSGFSETTWIQKMIGNFFWENIFGNGSRKK